MFWCGVDAIGYIDQGFAHVEFFFEFRNGFVFDLVHSHMLRLRMTLADIVHGDSDGLYELTVERLNQNQKKFNRNFGRMDVLPLLRIVADRGRG